MEVEIEDLHLQIDDIVKAKTAVRTHGVQSRTRAAEGRWSHLLQTRLLLQPRTFCRESRPPLLCLSPLRGLGGGGETEEEASEGPSPCLTTCMWEFGHRPQHHK